MKYPKYHSEFEVQSKLYNLLKQESIDVRGEVSDGINRYDLVVFLDKKPVCIIETKKAVPKQKFRTQNCKRNNNQMMKYKEATGLPVYWCQGMRQTNKVAKKVILHIKRLKGEIKIKQVRGRAKPYNRHHKIASIIAYRQQLNATSLCNKNAKLES